MTRPEPTKLRSGIDRPGAARRCLHRPQRRAGPAGHGIGVDLDLRIPQDDRGGALAQANEKDVALVEPGPVVRRSGWLKWAELSIQNPIFGGLKSKKPQYLVDSNQDGPICGLLHGCGTLIGCS